MVKTVVKKIFNQLGYEVINKKAPAQLYYDLDREFHDRYELAQEKCQMAGTDNALRRQRHYTLSYLLKNAPLASGDVCELGCWRGLSACQIAHHLRAADAKIAFHIFDSFEGLSPFEAADIPEGGEDGLEARRKQFACSLATVQDNLKEFPFIRYYKGWIPNRFSEVKDRPFSFVHIDVDMYQPIADSFRFFYPRLVKQGIMVFDDYGYTQFPGAKKAVDECLEEFHYPFFVPLPSGQAFLIKGLKD